MKYFGTITDPKDLVNKEYVESAINDVKDDLYTVNDTFLTGQSLLLGDWVQGYSNVQTGEISTAINYRVTHANWLSYPVDVTITPASGFSLNAFDSEFALISGTTTSPVMISANTLFRVNLRKTAENPAEPADVKAFVNAFTVSNRLEDLINTFMLKGCAALPSGTDLNDVTTMGVYPMGYSSTYTNCPVAPPARLLLGIYGNDKGHPQLQTLINKDTGDVFIRQRIDGAWATWITVRRNIDATLTIAGDAADAKATGDGLGYLNRALTTANDTFLTGQSHLLGDWVQGYSNVETGKIVTAINYRVTHANWLSYPVDVTITPVSGYAYNAFDSDFNLLTGTTTGAITIPANTSFRVNIRRSGTETTDPADPEEFGRKIIVGSDFTVSISPYAPRTLNTHTHTIAHRGVPSVCPGGTKPSYIMAKKVGLLIAEADIRFTSDNVPVVFHDASYTVDGVTHYIANETYEQFMQYDIGAAYSPEFTGTYGLTLSDFLDLCNKLQLFPTLDFKVGTTSQIQECLGIIDAKRARIFNYKASVSNLKTIINYDPHASVRLGADDYSQTLYNNLVEILNYGQKTHQTHCIFAYGYGTWTTEQIATCRATGAIMGVSSVNNNIRLKTLTEDVDIIFTENGFNATMYKTLNEIFS